MPNSLITKKRIAKAFKECLHEKDFEKVSVKDIMTQAQMRRQTFYSHFLDKYELLEWIFKTDLQEQIIDNIHYISGIGLLHEVCYFFEQNRSFYAQLFSIHSQNDFLTYFQDYCLEMIVKIVVEYCDEHQISLPQVEKNFFLQYHAAGLAQIIKQNLDQAQSDFFSLGQFIEVMLVSFLNYYRLEDE